jgi:hypothetical protein
MPHPVEAESMKLAAELKGRIADAGGDLAAFPSDDRVARFIRVNGVWWVMEAAKRTCKRLQAARSGNAPPVAEPWVYLRAVVNGRPARAQHLYLLLYLWESSLRARIDWELTYVWSAKWYEQPDRYLSAGHYAMFVKKQGDFLEQDQRGNTRVRLGDFPNARAFLRELYLDALHNILLDNWDRRFRTRLPHPVKGQVLASELNSWLRDAFDARKEVMHADRIELPFFLQSVTALTLLLEILEFDATKTIDAIEKRDPHAEDDAL